MKKLLVVLFVCAVALPSAAQSFLGSPGRMSRQFYFQKSQARNFKGRLGAAFFDPYQPHMPTGISNSGTGTALNTDYPNTAGYANWLICTTDCHTETKPEGGAYDKYYCPSVACDVNSSSLQLALDDMPRSTILRLKAGQTFLGSNINLKAKIPAPDVNHWMIVQTSDCKADGSCLHLPVQQTRVCSDVPTNPSLMPHGCGDATNMAKIMPNAMGSGCLLQMKNDVGGGNCGNSLDANAGFVRLGPGLEITTEGFDTGASGVGYTLISIGADAETDVTKVPDHVIFDRDYIHGAPYGSTGQNIHLGLYVGSGKNIGLVDSYFGEFHSIADNGGEAPAVRMMGMNGPFKAVNNRFDAASIAMFIGGAWNDTFTDKTWEINPDVEVRNNLYWKNWPLWANKNLAAKNLFEIKVGHRILVEANILMYCWAEAQTTCAVFRSTSEGACDPIRCNTNDVTYRFNLINHNCQPYAGLAAGSYKGPDQTTAGVFIASAAWPRRWEFHDNASTDTQVLDNYVAPSWPGCDGDFTVTGVSNVSEQGGATYIHWNHNTSTHVATPLHVSNATNPTLPTLPVAHNHCNRVTGVGSGSAQGQAVNALTDWCFDHTIFNDNLISSALYNSIRAVEPNNPDTTPPNVGFGDAALGAIATNLEVKTTPYVYVTGLSYRSNILANDGALCQGSACGGFFAQAEMNENLGSCKNNTATCYVTTSGIGMVDYAGCRDGSNLAGCALALGSTYKGSGSDCAARTARGLSCDPGADIAALMNKIACTMTGTTGCGRY
jgi:hypothetical protein